MIQALLPPSGPIMRSISAQTVRVNQTVFSPFSIHDWFTNHLSLSYRSITVKHSRGGYQILLLKRIMAVNSTYIDNFTHVEKKRLFDTKPKSFI